MNRIEHDKKIIRKMIYLYCRHNLKMAAMTDEYLQLADYACQRLIHCRWGNDKPTCKDCPAHCYAHEKRQKMQQIMKWVGPRMIIYSPLIAIQHIWQGIIKRPHS